MKQKICAAILFALAIVPALVALVTGSAVALQVTQYATVLIVGLGFGVALELAVALVTARDKTSTYSRESAHAFLMSQAKMFCGRTTLQSFAVAGRSILSVVLLIALGLNLLSALTVIMTVSVYLLRGYSVRYMYAHKRSHG